LVVLLLVAGCAGRTPASTPVPDASGTSPSTPGATTADGLDVCGTPVDATDAYLTSIPPEERLVLEAAEDLTVTVSEYADEALEDRTARETYALSNRQTISVDEFCVDGWIVLTVDGETAWKGVIGSANHIEFRLTADGNATITESYVS
jgi:hypothetical protein